jgi:hypothetical protein
MSDTSVDAQQPWLGLDSFSEATRGYFHGREEEIAELARRVQRKPLTVLFGQSGLGKTSILRAGLVPRLRPEGYCPVYLRVDYNADAPPPAEQLKLAVFRETQASGTWSKTGVAVKGESLWEFLHHRDDQLVDAQGRVLTPLLIFDQFEEIFTLAQADDAGRARAALFIQELADLVENRPPRALEARLEHDDTLIDRFDFARCDYRVLIALREDYLAHLEALKGSMPSITQNRMRLARMTGAQALEAVLKPGGALVTQEVAESIVRFVAGGAELRNAEVEPSLLSLICRELNATRIAQGKGEISADLLAGSHATILAEFYQRALADQPPGVHRFIEEELLTDSGFRENVAQERVLKAFAEAGAVPDALARLVDRRLLRIEERLDVRRVELTHDVLCSVVGAARQVRHERDARDAAEAQLAAQREREAATRAALIRARKVAAVCGVLAVVAAGAAAFGIWGMREAQSTRAVAEAARSESERLIVYLLDDFYRELEPVGRLEIVGELAQRALAYYDGLPPELRGAETRRNQALAQARHGLVLRNQGRNDEAGRMLGAAVPTLEAMRAGGDRSEATAIGLSLGLIAQSRLATGLAGSGPVALAQRAVDALQSSAEAAATPAAAASGANASRAPGATRRRALAVAFSQLGFAQQRAGLNEPALASLKTSLAEYRALGLDTDHDAASNFAITAAWTMDALRALGRRDEALLVGDEATAVATRVLERSPTHMLALRGRALLAGSAASNHGANRHYGRMLASANAASDDWLLLARVDPGNVVTRNNLGVSDFTAARALMALGRPRDALARFQQDRGVVEARVTRSPMVQVQTATRLVNAAITAAQLGQLALSDRLAGEGSQQLRAAVNTLPPDSVDARSWPLRERGAAAELAWARGDLQRARQEARGLREGLLAIDLGNDDALRRTRAEALANLHETQAAVELEARNHAAAEQQLRWLIETFRDRPTTQYQTQRDLHQALAGQALAVARQGRIDDARPIAAQALAFWRRHHDEPGDDQLYKQDFALALVAAAWTEPAQAKALLDEAQKAFDSMPAEARALRWSRVTEGFIAEARRELR